MKFIAHQKLIQPHLNILFWLGVYILIIFQDYIYSVLRHTGFYWSEVLLFNLYWLLFIPLTFLIGKSVQILDLKSKLSLLRILLLVGFALVFSAVHILIFSSFFTAVSNLLFSPPHQFSRILISCVSNDLYITILVYFFTSFFFQFPKNRKTIVEKNTNHNFPKTFPVKKGERQILIDTSAIYYFNSDKPYTVLHTAKEKYLLQQSLKAIENTLDPEKFLRVHRSTIVNKSFIKELISRKNGDYDVLLKNNQTIRMSRHYRKNWEGMITTST